MACFQRFWFKEPRGPETIPHENCYLYRSRRLEGLYVPPKKPIVSQPKVQHPIITKTWPSYDYRIKATVG